MEFIVALAIVIALLSVSALCVYAIVVLRDTRSVLRDVQNHLTAVSDSMRIIREEIQQLSGRLIGIFEYIEKTAKFTSSISEKIHTDLIESKGIFAEIDSLRTQISSIREFLSSNVVQPLRQFATIISAVQKSVSAFFKVLKP